MRQPQYRSVQRAVPWGAGATESKIAIMVVKVREEHSTQEWDYYHFHSGKWRLLKTYAFRRGEGGKSKKEQIQLFSLSLFRAKHFECSTLKGVWCCKKNYFWVPLTSLPNARRSWEQGIIRAVCFFKQERMVGNSKVIKLLEVVKWKLMYSTTFMFKIKTWFYNILAEIRCLYHFKVNQEKKMKLVFCLNRVSVNELNDPIIKVMKPLKWKQLILYIMNLIYFHWMNYKGLFTGLAKIHYLWFFHLLM